MAATTSKWLTPREAAQYCSLDEQTLRRAVRDGKLTAYRVRGGARIRYRVEDLDAFMSATPKVVVAP